MTLISALRSVSKSLNNLNVHEAAILKDNVYGYVMVTTPECVRYQLRHNKENVLMIYVKRGWHAQRTSVNPKSIK